MEICQLNISKGVDDFLEVTIIDKGDKEEKQKIGRCVKIDLSPPNITSFSLILTPPPGFRTSIDLTQLTREKTHNLWLKLKDRVAGEFHLYFRFHHHFHINCRSAQMIK